MINPNHLKYFYDSCSFNSVSKAAEVNKVSHSAISHAIKSIENQLNVELLKHGKKKFELTEQGKTLFQHSNQLFDSFEILKNALSSDSIELSGQLKLGLSHSTSIGFMNDYIGRFVNLHSQIEPRVMIGNSKSLELLLNSREIDLGFGLEDGSLAQFERKSLLKGRFVLAASKRYKKGDTFIVGDKGFEITALNDHHRKLKKRVHTIVVQSWAISADLAQDGVGVALIPDFVLAKHRDSLVQVMSEVRLPKYDLCAFYRSYNALSPVARKFLSDF
ncbi:MAG: hypothetical protein COW00_06935 [Bdellovibrio sp. CG12_big_fil_rev_8_21_14_0_65_39_13]|nr:MAG: hypothetical protein COW78_03055 [Bdellovibrio sp. CG22_combo_CG10-13_8_21_14_all_39_27]PIQ60338.1 MAG: hypothetical protein COW00_06935 [Bdellovibrio sp. CG12_big_fil_rev_8_21_14_0_65_39_13]PIR35052.1 MAG: hypothetical protein COV37_10530 [Bdellovibrio sp. CG11_big_fil_rev_8_21_14_0_20_39_38]PJB53345.1 MAG: hypothetical protein CO099_07655 [Bdellovibrio sp. CG_4_9_14_3_um_filter_39_7]